jgi:DNA mismatch repair protein MutL
MAKIRILTDRVANQIAAGEVIERPAAVVKELVENALDAGATRIEVEFRHGGRSLMRIEDNGQGMGRDDALLSLERHATSKIVAAADLDRLGTFGFRGEALPSIASVSRFLLQTREATAAEGTEILVDGGKFRHVRECGRPVGTRIEVTQLFNSVPARRKFLKTDQTEAAHIVQCVRLYALACPRTAFTLIEDGRLVFRSPECVTLAERVVEIFGRQIGSELVPIEALEPGLRLSGLIGKPGAGRATRHEMITFVNSRPVDSRTLNYALIESYHQSLPKGRYPLAFVFLELDPAAVDVNVHPAKREVRFRSEPAVRSFVIRAVLQRLRELGEFAGHGVVPEAGGQGPAAPGGGVVGGAAAVVPAGALDRSRGPQGSDPTQMPAGSPAAPAAALHRADLAALTQPTSALGTPASGFAPSGFPPSVLRPPSSAAPVAGAAPHWRFLGLAHGSYALFETPAGIVLLDRRAAHERVWFERLQEQFRAGSVASQRLLLPIPVELDPVTTSLLVDGRAFLLAHGFEVAEFGRNFFRIEAVPAWMEPADAEPFLRDVLGAMREGRLPERNPDLASDELARLAATKAIRLPTSAGAEENLALVRQLFATRSPLTSPAGRPTYVEMGHAELDRRFER